MYLYTYVYTFTYMCIQGIFTYTLYIHAPIYHTPHILLYPTTKPNTNTNVKCIHIHTHNLYPHLSTYTPQIPTYAATPLYPYTCPVPFTYVNQPILKHINQSNPTLHPIPIPIYLPF